MIYCEILEIELKDVDLHSINQKSTLILEKN